MSWSMLRVISWKSLTFRDDDFWPFKLKIGTTKLNPALRNVHVNLGFLCLFIFKLRTWRGWTDRQRDGESTHAMQSVKLPQTHHHHHFWQAPLRARRAKRRHQSPEWTVLSQVNCVVHIEVAGFQILLNGFHPCNTKTSQWSRPVSCGGSG